MPRWYGLSWLCAEFAMCQVDPVVGGGGGGRGGGWDLRVIVVQVFEPIFQNLPFIYLAFEKTNPFIYLIVRNVDLFLYCPLIFYTVFAKSAGLPDKTHFFHFVLQKLLVCLTNVL